MNDTCFFLCEKISEELMRARQIAADSAVEDWVKKNPFTFIQDWVSRAACPKKNNNYAARLAALIRRSGV